MYPALLLVCLSACSLEKLCINGPCEDTGVYADTGPVETILIFSFSGEWLVGGPEDNIVSAGCNALPWEGGDTGSDLNFYLVSQADPANPCQVEASASGYLEKHASLAVTSASLGAFSEDVTECSIISPDGFHSGRAYFTSDYASNLNCL